ncbi:hypothetical protein CAPTEDRAFT_191420 [Capitella teleta]|uniref:SH3 domain-containing protein n=1 Tax=Capitella teleta TaxID=283909 RepID=R7VGW2_CAPTE|nr:hypothetical protein CAPTEDRAFT_191420 [Capitella teleta]|eukprot:ELU17797.1 hypothetical protein CAPTEDRAFT_191420 [Capitella teleta]
MVHPSAIIVLALYCYASFAETKIVKGLYNYESQNDEKLNFNKGDFMEIISEGSKWSQVRHLTTGETGYIPSNYVVEERSLENEEDNNNADDQQEGTFLVRESENKTDELTLSVAAINEESDHVVSGDCDPKKAAKDNETDEMTNSGLENSISSALERDISAVNTSTNDQTEATLISDADNMDIQFGFLEDQEAENIQATEAVLENSASISNNGEINQYVNVNNIQLLILQG